MTAEKDIHQILSAFVDDISTEESLENYWKKNKTAVKTLQQMNYFLYLELVEKFKKATMINFRLKFDKLESSDLWVPV